MTEYGRGPGSEPWHPEDPLFGDQGWSGQQAAPGHGQGQGRYEGQQQPYAQDPYTQQGYPQDPYAQQHQQDPYAQPPQQQYGHQQDPYAQPPQQYYGQQQDPYAQQQHQQQPQYGGGWDTGQQTAMPYDPQAASYGAGPGGYGDQPDHYGTPEAYPPPQPPGHRPQQQEPEPEPAGRNTDWDPDAPQEETHPFFTGTDAPADDRDARSRSRRDDDDDDHEDGSRAPRRSGGERRGKGKKKSRNGCACLGVAVVLVGGLGGVTYLGYSYYQDRFGAAPDYAGSGSGSVEVEIPEGAYGNEIANILKKAGVVKSADAFISAQNGNPKGKSLQAGVYLLKKEMSAKSAVELMLSPSSQNALVIPEGTSTAGVYQIIDKRLELKEGTTAEVARTRAESLGLPEWADDDPKIKDPLEGFLFPAAYPVKKGSKPEDALKKMVTRANKEYAKLDLAESAAKLNLKSPLELLTVASLVQKEGKYKHDFDKVSRVVYNRLKPDNTQTAGRLEFDSTINYIRQESTLDIGAVDEVRKIEDPYNTYSIKGLPLGPITNPGIDALQSAIKPADGPWYYFVSINEDKTLFAVTNDEHNRNRAEYEEQKKADQ